MNTLDLTNMLFRTKGVNDKGWVWSPEKLKLIEDVTWICPRPINGTWTSKDGFLNIVNNVWTFKKDFVWDGATDVPSGDPDTTPNLPVISLTNKPVPLLWKSTLIHDAGYGSLSDPTFPFRKFAIDYFFFRESKKAHFQWSLIYFWGVRLFGGAALYLSNLKQN